MWCYMSICIYIYIHNILDEPKEKEKVTQILSDSMAIGFVTAVWPDKDWFVVPRGLCFEQVGMLKPHLSCLLCARDGPWTTCTSKRASRNKSVIFWRNCGLILDVSRLSLCPLWVQQLCDLARSMMVESSRIHWQGPTSSKEKPLEERRHSFATRNNGPNAKWTV